MSNGFGQGLGRREGAGRTPGQLLRTGGRVALWALVGVLLISGISGLFAAPEEPGPEVRRAGGADYASAAFAVRFARTYLESPAREALTPFLAAGAQVGSGRPPSAEGAEVAQAEAIRFSALGDGRVIVTVACQLRDSRTLYLAVPIVRFRVGEVAALGAPSIVAVPAVAGASPERPQPLIGPGGEAIAELVRKFLPAYLSAQSTKDLAYLLVPGTTVVPLGGGLVPEGAPHLSQVDSGEGRKRSVLATIRVADPSSGAAYPLTYRLEVERRGERWYVAAVEGAVA